MGDRETEALAWSRVGVEPVEHLEDLGLVLGCDADAVVGDGVERAAVDDAAGDVDPRRRVWSAVLERVIEEVGENLAGLRVVPAAHRQRVDVHFGAGLVELEAYRGEQLGKDAVDVERADLEGDATQARITQ